MELGQASRQDLPVARQRGLIWLAGLLLVGGEAAGAIVGSFHAGSGANANNNAAISMRQRNAASSVAAGV
jgi:hypothetical protein